MAEPSESPPASPEAPHADGEAPYAHGEAQSWAEVLARWDDQKAHQAYLARYSDLDGLTTAGRRYREVLAARPTDATALAMKAEVVKRATVVGLSMLPRTAPPRVLSGRWKRILLLTFAAWIGSTLIMVLWKLFTGYRP